MRATGIVFLAILGCDVPGESSFDGDVTSIDADATSVEPDEEAPTEGPCIDTGGCDGSPVGVWQHEFCEEVTGLSDYVVTDEGELEYCRLRLVEQDFRRSGRLVIDINGSYSEEYHFSGPYVAYAYPDCLEKFAISCSEVPAFERLGAQTCYEEGEHCRCEGFIQREERSDGTWTSVGGSMTFDGDGYTMTVRICAGTTGLHMLATNGDLYREFRRLSSP